MKKRCQEAAALEQVDSEAGRAKWIELDREFPGARIAFIEGTDQVMEKLCEEHPDAQECKVFED